MRRRQNPAELLLLNPAATRPLTMAEVQTVMHALEVPKPWRTRFLEGLEVEWREHGGGIDAHSVGALVVDHLNEDENYYRRARQNPAVRIPKGMRPLIEAYGEQIAKLASRVVHEVTGEPLDVQWTPRTEPLGAGSWGVVYPTRDPRFVVKVTADPTEGPIVSTIMSEPQLHNHMGIIHYFALRKLPEDVVFRGKTFPVFVIVAERLKDVGGLRGMSWNQSREDRHLTNLLIKIKDVAGKLVHEKQKKRPSQRAIDDLDEQYLDLVGQINDGPLSDFFFQFRDATETGVLADVHLNNLGKRAVDWETVTNGAVPLSDSDWHWVISDPGHSSVETHPDIAPLRENPRRRNPIPARDPTFSLDPINCVAGTVLEDYCVEDDAGFFHVTTRGAKVFEEGRLRSRSDVGVIGLGGGRIDPGKHVSVVINYSRARWLYDAIKNLSRTCKRGTAVDVVKLVLDWTGFPHDNWSLAFDDDPEEGATWPVDLLEFVYEIGMTNEGGEDDYGRHDLTFRKGWDALLAEEGAEVNKKWNTPEQRYELAQFMEDRLESTFYHEDWWDDGICVPLVGFTAAPAEFLRIDPDDVTIVQVALRGDVGYVELIPRECELRLPPADIQIVAVGCEDERNRLPVPPRDD